MTSIVDFHGFVVMELKKWKVGWNSLTWFRALGTCWMFDFLFSDSNFPLFHGWNVNLLVGSDSSNSRSLSPVVCDSVDSTSCSHSTTHSIPKKIPTAKKKIPQNERIQSVREIYLFTNSVDLPRHADSSDAATHSSSMEMLTRYHLPTLPVISRQKVGFYLETRRKISHSLLVSRGGSKSICLIEDETTPAMVRQGRVQLEVTKTWYAFNFFLILTSSRVVSLQAPRNVPPANFKLSQRSLQVL